MICGGKGCGIATDPGDTACIGAACIGGAWSGAEAAWPIGPAGPDDATGAAPLATPTIVLAMWTGCDAACGWGWRADGGATEGTPVPTVGADARLGAAFGREPSPPPRTPISVDTSSPLWRCGRAAAALSSITSP